MTERKDFDSTLNVVEKIDLLHSEITRLVELDQQDDVTEKDFDYVKEIYETCVKIEHYQGILDSGKLLLKLHITLNDLYSALEVANKTFSYVSLIPDVDGFVDLLNSMATAFYMDGSYEKSFTELVKLHNFATEYEIEDAVIISAVNRGDILRLIGAHSEAEEHFESVIKKYENSGSVNNSIYETALLNMCESIIESKTDISRTEVYFDKVLDLLDGVTDSFGYAYYASIKAKYLYANGSYTEAVKFYYDCLEVYKGLKEEFYKYETIMTFAKILLKEKDYQECLNLLREYDLEKTNLGSAKLSMIFHEVCARAHEALGDLEKAVKHYKMFIHYQGDDHEQRDRQIARIRRIIKEDEYRQRVKKLHEENITDQLTKVYNRKKMLADIKQIFVDEEGRHQNYAILMLDLDNFKFINDYNGHVAGDKCLQQVGRVLKEVCDAYNGISYRYGGDEFFIIFTSPLELDLFEIGEHLRKSIEALKIFADVDNKKIFVTASVGVLGFASNRDTRAREIITEVDELMYKAKKATKNATVIKSKII